MNNLNWKLRLKNKTTLLSLIGCLVAFVYQLAGILGYNVPVNQDEMVQMLGLFISALAAVGVVVDPTTKGIADSEQAQRYKAPR